MTAEEQIVSILTNDSAVTAINSNRVYFIQAPQKEMSTYIVFNMVREPIRTKDGIAGYTNTLLTEIYAKKNTVAFSLESAVINAFEAFSGAGTDPIRKIDFVESAAEKNEETNISIRIIKSSLTVKNQ